MASLKTICECHCEGITILVHNYNSPLLPRHRFPDGWLQEHTITAPLPEDALKDLIHKAYGDDTSTAMLTQELLVYLAMFIRTEPQLFHEMLRLRVGLIIQVMAKELAKTLNCDGEQASEHLLNLSPFEMKNLLHHIMSGKEFAISSVAKGNFSIVSTKSSRVSKKSQIGIGEMELNDENIGAIDDRQGQWLRRRRLDGALNRVPRDFYSRVWTVLERVSVWIWYRISYFQ